MRGTFPLPSLNGRSWSGEPTFAGMGGKEDDAPEAAIRSDVRLSSGLGFGRIGAGRGRWAHARINLARDPVSLHNLHAVVETAGLALHDEKPERIARLFDQAVPDCSFGGPRAGMWQVLPARPQAAVQAAPAPTPAPGRFRIRELHIQNEVTSTPWTAPCLVRRPSTIYRCQGSVQTGTSPQPSA
jgi:hypothetical protein